MSRPSVPLRILLVVPEPVFQPQSEAPEKGYWCPPRGQATDFLGFLASDLHHLGVDVHVVQPEFRQVFRRHTIEAAAMACCDLPAARVHLTRDRVFYYSPGPARSDPGENLRVAAAFQREVMHHTIPEVQPSLIHAVNWMSGLIPPHAAQGGIPCLFTLTSPATARVPLWWVEDMGIDAAWFWQRLFFDRLPGSYEETRVSRAVDLLLSGVNAASHVNAVSLPGWTAQGTKHRTPGLAQVIARKEAAGSVSWLRGEAIHTQHYIDLYERLLRAPVIRPAQTPPASLFPAPRPVQERAPARRPAAA